MNIITKRELADVLAGLDKITEEAGALAGSNQYANGYYDGLRAALVAIGLVFGLGRVQPQREGPVWIEVNNK